MLLAYWSPEQSLGLYVILGFVVIMAGLAGAGLVLWINTVRFRRRLKRRSPVIGTGWPLP